MNDPDLPELALTEKEVDEILRSCDGRALLVGGQALAFWAQYYGIVPIDVLGENVTSDADFIGTAAVARGMAAALKSKGWRYWQPTMDSATPQTAKLSKRIEGKGIKQIDFLDSIIGLERERVMRRAVTLHLRDGTRLQLLHPLDVLESRLKNLAVLPSKRNRQGIAQARLAIDITRAFLEELVSEGKMRLLLTAIERIHRKLPDVSTATAPTSAAQSEAHFLLRALSLNTRLSYDQSTGRKIGAGTRTFMSHLLEGQRQ